MAGGMFDYFESHPAIKAINYFNYNSRPDTASPGMRSRAVYLYGGQVNYLPNVNDDDYRLLAESGAHFRGTVLTADRRSSLPDFDPRPTHRPAG